MKMPPVAVAFLAASIASAAAQTYPSRPVTIVVPYPAGGPTDTLARILADRMRPALGQSVIIENPTGAGGTIGTGRVARAAAECGRGSPNFRKRTRPRRSSRRSRRGSGHFERENSSRWINSAMPWAVVLSNRAERNLRRVPAADRARLLSAIDTMRVDPLHGDVVKLKGAK